MRKTFFLLAMVGAGWLGAACAARTAVAPPTGANGRLLADVPFFSDTTDQCGPSVLASVFQFWGKGVSPAEVRAGVYLPQLGGTLPMDMAPALRRGGLKGEML